MKHERRVVQHVSGWREAMPTCVCGNAWPCIQVPGLVDGDEELNKLRIDRSELSAAQLEALHQMQALSEQLKS